jgi:hypothetical protein
MTFPLFEKFDLDMPLSELGLDAENLEFLIRSGWNRRDITDQLMRARPTMPAVEVVWFIKRAFNELAELKNRERAERSLCVGEMR